MSQPIRVLYIGPAKSEAFDTSSLEQQSRAVKLAGGMVVRYEGHTTAELVRALQEADVPRASPAEAEVVIEGYIDTEWVEPEAPFGESHGHVALEEFNMPMRITCITHRRKPVIPSYISQVAPSESSVIKRVAYEPLFLAHLRDALGIRGVKKVSLHEPLTGLLRVTIITIQKGTPRSEVWRLSLSSSCRCSSSRLGRMGSWF